MPSCISRVIYWYIYWCIRRSFRSLTNLLIHLQSELFLDKYMHSLIHQMIKSVGSSVRLWIHLWTHAVRSMKSFISSLNWLISLSMHRQPNDLPIDLLISFSIDWLSHSSVLSLVHLFIHGQIYYFIHQFVAASIDIRLAWWIYQFICDYMRCG